MKQKVQTDFGTFTLTVEDDFKINLHTRQMVVTGKNISIGGKYSCVSIKIMNDSDRGKLNNVKVQDGGCELYDKPVRGNDTIKLINLAFTAVRQYAPHVKYLDFDDNSKFICTISDGSKVGMSLALYELIFYEQTWYERHFGAELADTYLKDKYDADKTNFTKPMSSELISFNNKSLNSDLLSLLDEKITFREFFHEISKIKNKCEVIFPWYMDVIKLILPRAYHTEDWQVNLYNPKIQIIPYKVLSTGGRRRYNTTRKRYLRTTHRNRCGGGEETIRELWPEEIYNLKIIPRY
jgi:hypothetical protein